MTTRCRVALLAAALLCASAAHADRGRLLATPGVSPIEGGAGGGLTPWATIAGYGSRDGSGGSAFVTRLDSGDYSLDVAGGAWGWRNRLELSWARQRLGLPRLADQLDLPTRAFGQDVFGAKLRLAGDLVYDRWPQLALGLQYKRQRDFAIPQAIGARDSSDIEPYVSVSRLFLAGAWDRHLLLNLTARSTRANQAGLLGFGGDRGQGRMLAAEASAVLLLDRHWALGAEFRQKPDNLSFAREDHWRDLFLAWFPNKRVAVVAAWIDLGAIATLPGQRAWYLSVQLSQ